MNPHFPITQLQLLSTHGQSCFFYTLPTPCIIIIIILKKIPDIITFHLSFCISKRQRLHILNKTSVLSPHRELLENSKCFHPKPSKVKMSGGGTQALVAAQSSQVILMLLFCLVWRQKLSGRG